MAGDYTLSDLPALQRARDIIIRKDIINIVFTRGRRELKIQLPAYSIVKDLRDRISEEFGILVLCLRLKDGNIMIDERPICLYGTYICCK